LNGVIQDIVREYHWPPTVIGGLFFDAQDYRGLFFWHKEICDRAEKFKKKKP